jgi:hypothetical protein
MEEIQALKNFKGTDADLGQPEIYMRTMIPVRTAAPSRIQCMIYKQQFKSRVLECRALLGKIENACDDVRLCVRLKKFLKVVLRVGNQLNEGEEGVGFSLESLQKLHLAKAFDQKTTVLQYIVMLVFRNDPDTLQFPADLKHISEASKVKMDLINKEKDDLRKEFDVHFKSVLDIQENEPENDVGLMIDFLSKVSLKLKMVNVTVDSKIEDQLVQ